MAAAVAPVDAEAGYAPLGRPNSAELRRQYSSHHAVPKDLHAIPADVESQLKLGFIRKVYGILAAQMLLTVAICLFCMSSHTIRLAVVGIWGNTYMRILTFVPTLAVLCCMQAAKNNYPVNFYLLTIFTVLMSLDVGVVCAAFTEVGLGYLIVQAFLLTAVIFVGLSAYTLWSGADYNWCRAYLFGCLLVLITLGLLGVFFPFLVNNFVFSLFGALVFCGYIVFDTYRITKVFGYDDYIIAAIELYLDIVNLFLYILQILAASRD